MTNTSVLFESFNERYQYVRTLISNKSKQDLENEPYKCKYEAKDVLFEIEKGLLPLLTDEENLTAVNDRLAVVYNLLGTIFYDVEEPHNGDEYTKKALDLLSNEPISPERIICYISTLNQFGYAACKYNKPDLSIEHLEKAESAYHSFQESHSEYQSIGFLFGFIDDEEGNELEKYHTQTLFYLAQVYSVKGLRLKSAKYCHTTLRRQLELTEYDPVDWALNSATLSQYLIESNAYREARTHLAAAQYMVEKHKEELDKGNNETDELKAQKESLRHRRADVFRCWAKYGIYLLNASKNRLMSSEGDKVDPPPKPPAELAGLNFPAIKDEIKEHESSITCELILTYEDAKPVFLKSQEWLNVAKEYYTLEDHASDHVSILQDSSQLYLLLAFFHQDEPTQCKLHKRRIDLLEKAVNELNPNYYLKVCRELWYELGETSHVMAYLKFSQGESSQNEHLLGKSQHYFKEGIKYFERFLSTFKLPSNGKVDRFPEEYEETIVEAYIYLGRMYSKLTSQDKAQLLRTQKESLRCYRAVFDYCSSHPEKERFATELGISREMVQLIPLKLVKIDKLM